MKKAYFIYYGISSIDYTMKIYAYSKRCAKIAASKHIQRMAKNCKVFAVHPSN